MPFQHSPPSTKTRSQARARLFSLQLQELLLTEPQHFPGLARTTFKGSGEDGEEEEENSAEEEESDGNEGVPSPVGESQGTGGPTLSQYNQPFSHKSEPSLLAIIQKMTQIMANLQEESRPPTFKTPSMKAPECFDWTQTFKVRSFIQSCQLIFQNDLANLS
ncbi:hypothetical protein O181_077154 [Austropuccinia psidii MF-1]|uniref:Uncharacterized protein n=1 Tax=Austropuccinia psidii MF-1 TaxID=1389203 RepID=A0A9Q3FEE3_9BASI|nr:hypothetical protein [Austropuccinia psidii MF-1]